MASFFSAASCKKKDTIFGAAQSKLGPSNFVRALMGTKTHHTPVPCISDDLLQWPRLPQAKTGRQPGPHRGQEIIVNSQKQ